MKYLFCTFAILTFLIISVNAQATRKTSLLVSNCKAGQETCGIYELFRYDFVNGEYVGKEKIVTVKFSDVIFNGWGDKIYRNRYVLTRFGDIIDVLEKKILHDGEGELHRTDGNKIYTRILNHRYKNGLYVFDLDTKKYELVRKVDDNFIFGELSPNGIRSAKHWCSIKNVCGIEISESGNKKKLIKGTFITITSRGLNSADLMRVPIFWLDDKRILTQTTNGKLVIVSVNGTITPLLQIEMDKYPYHNPYFYRNEDGEIIYDCDEKYLIDVEAKTFKSLGEGYIGKGFSEKKDESVKYLWGFGDIFFHNGNEIGRAWAMRPVANENFLAVLYGEYGSNLGYPDGVKVWNNIKKDWTTIEIKPLPEIIGWIEE
jgi:hypothetical protein